MPTMSGMPIALAIASSSPTRWETHTHSSVTAVTEASSGPPAFTTPAAVTVSSSSKLPAGTSSPPFRARGSLVHLLQGFQM